MMKIKGHLPLTLFLGIIIFPTVFYNFAQPYRISGNCMESSIQDKKWYFLNKMSRYFGQYRVGDIILFNHEGRIWVSRIVALEKNVIQINENNLTVNGKKLQDSIHRNWSSWRYGTYAIDNDFQVPSDHVYVLSDNLSAQHDDSRVFGAISNSSILGKLW